MWKNLFKEHGAKNAITLFHKQNNPSSSRVFTLLKQANASAKSTATEDQASSHDGHSAAAQQGEFELEVTEQAPTGDQLRSILEFVGDSKVGSIIEGATDAADAQRRLRMDINALKRPLTVDWNGGQVVIGDNESELQKLIKAAKGNA